MSDSDQLGNLEAVQDAGAKKVSTEGLTVEFDPAAVSRRAAILRDKTDPTKRPRVASIDLSGF